MKITLDIPQTVMRQALAINELCEKSECRVDMRELAPIVDRGKDYIISSVKSNHCPFGFCNSEERCLPTLPVLPVWAWFMRDFLQITDHIEVDDNLEAAP